MGKVYQSRPYERLSDDAMLDRISHQQSIQKRHRPGSLHYHVATEALKPLLDEMSLRYPHGAREAHAP